MIKTSNCQTEKSNYRGGSENSLGGDRKVQGVDYRGNGEIIFSSKVVKPGLGVQASQSRHGKINMVDFAVNNWAQHEDMRSLVEQEKKDTRRKFKSYNEGGDWKMNDGHKWKGASENEMVTPLLPSRPSSIVNSHMRQNSLDTPDNFRLSKSE